MAIVAIEEASTNADVVCGRFGVAVATGPPVPACRPGSHYENLRVGRDGPFSKAVYHDTDRLCDPTTRTQFYAKEVTIVARLCARHVARRDPA